LESESEEESEEDEEEGEKEDETGLVTPAEGLTTPSGITSIPAGMETPEIIELECITCRYGGTTAQWHINALLRRQ
jgi:hypothetical protein